MVETIIKQSKEELPTIMKKISGRVGFNVSEHTILLAFMGSIAHKTYKKNSIDDIDLVGIIIPPLQYVLGLQKLGNRDTVLYKEDQWDITLYSIRKVFDLLIKCNPNIIGLLSLDKELYVQCSPIGQMLLDNKNLFRDTEKTKQSFCGYATNQLKNIHKYEYKGYMGTHRKTLVEKYGFDCKNASHLIRLLYTGIRMLKENNINLSPEELNMVIKIKNGEVELEEIQQLSTVLFNKINEINLPKETQDLHKIEELLLKLQLLFYKTKVNYFIEL